MSSAVTECATASVAFFLPLTAAENHLKNVRVARKHYYDTFMFCCDPLPLTHQPTHSPTTHVARLLAAVRRATTSVADAHRFAVRDLDYNPNKPFCLATCGEDRLIKFWDLRRPNAPVKTVVGHEHW